MTPASINPAPTFFDPLKQTIKNLIAQFDAIGIERKHLLQELSDFVARKSINKHKISLIFICTHNSRRSHIAQIWAQTAAAYFGIKNVQCYSGDTEATAFNPRAVEALKQVGFLIIKTAGVDNPIYHVSFSSEGDTIVAFSKVFDSETNPSENFAGVMTCSHAEANCPVVRGMEKRISLPYDDPKEFDGSEHEAAKYLERVNEIDREILFAFSCVSHRHEEIV
jgi:arsenate reductase